MAKHQNTNICNNATLRHNEEIEKIVLGSLLLESSAINEVIDMLKPDAFYSEQNKIIYSAIENLYNSGSDIDMITVSEAIKKAGKIEEAGGLFRISELTSLVGSTSHLRTHAMHLHDLMLSRYYTIAGMEITAKAQDESIDVDDVSTFAMGRIEAINQETEYGAVFESMNTLARQCLDNYGKRKEAAINGKMAGVTTGLNTLNRFTGGFNSSQLIILAGRPAMGKTAMLLHFAKSASLSGKNVLIFSLEMGSVPLTDRLILSESGIDPERYRNGILTMEEEGRICKARDIVSSLSIKVDKTANISIQQIKARARNQQSKNGCDIILIDYLQLIDMRQGNKSYNREQEVSQTSRACKIMAKELGVPVVLLSQLNRGNEGRADKRPMLSDLRESGAIEQDADIVLFVHRPEYYDKQAEAGKGELIIAKHREGQSGIVPFSYSKDLTRITDYGSNTNLPF